MALARYKLKGKCPPTFEELTPKQLRNIQYVKTAVAINEAQGLPRNRYVKPTNCIQTMIHNWFPDDTPLTPASDQVDYRLAKLLAIFPNVDIDAAVEVIQAHGALDHETDVALREAGII